MCEYQNVGRYYKGYSLYNKDINIHIVQILNVLR